MTSALDMCHVVRRKWESLQAQTSLPLDNPDDIEGPRDWALASSAPSGGASDAAPDTLHSLSAPRTGGSTSGEGAEHPAATTSHGPCPADRTAPPANSPATSPPWRPGEGRAAASHTTTVAANTQARESAATVRKAV